MSADVLTDRIQAAVIEVRNRNVQYIYRRHIAPLITPQLMEAHRARPFGPHDPDLEKVLTFLRWHHGDHPRYVAVCVDPERCYRIALHSRRRGDSLTFIAGSFATEGELEHAIFLRRIADLASRAEAPYG